MNFDTSKNLAGTGAILLFISPITLLFIGFLFPITGLAGVILLLVGAYGLAQYYREAGIFNNLLYGTIIGIVGGIASVFVAALAVIAFLPDFLYKIYPGWDGDWATLQNITPDTNNLTFTDIEPFLGILFGIVVVVFIIAVVVAFFYRKSLNELSEKTSIGLFGATGTVLIVGAVLIIAFGIGTLLV